MTNNFYCFDCEETYSSDIKPNHKFKNSYGKWRGIECLVCGGNAKKIGRKVGIASKLDPDAVAIYSDDGGNQIAVDKKGNTTKNKYERDSKGWKRSGKKISNYNSHNKKLKENYR